MRIILMFLVLIGSTAQAAPQHIVVLGDSLSAAYGIDQERAWVALLQQRLQQQGYDYRVHNASVSGETTAGGLRRLPQVLRQHPAAFVLIELGANDGLRAQSLDQMQSNLQTMVELSQAQGARVLLFEMRIPPNYGPRYTESFRQRYHAVAEQTGAALLPFFLTPIATDPAMFQDDGIHPTLAAQPILLDVVWGQLEPLLQAGQAVQAARLARTP